MKLCNARLWAHWHPDPSRAGGNNFELYEYKGVVKHPYTGADMFRFTSRRKDNGLSEIIYSADTLERMKSFRPFCLTTEGGE